MPIQNATFKTSQAGRLHLTTLSIFKILKNLFCVALWETWLAEIGIVMNVDAHVTSASESWCYLRIYWPSQKCLWIEEPMKPRWQRAGCAPPGVASTSSSTAIEMLKVTKCFPWNANGDLYDPSGGKGRKTLWSKHDHFCLLIRMLFNLCLIHRPERCLMWPAIWNLTLYFDLIWWIFGQVLFTVMSTGQFTFPNIKCLLFRRRKQNEKMISTDTDCQRMHLK